MSSDDRARNARSRRAPAGYEIAGLPGAHGSGDHPPQVPWQGITLVHRGVELGVIAHVTHAGRGAEAVLHAFGGVSQSLEYAVPERAIQRRLGVSARAIVNDDVEFEPQRLRGDGRVILAPRGPRGGSHHSDRSWSRLPAAAWIGMRVYAEDGYLGDVAGALPAVGSETPELLSVRVRTCLWKTRRPLVPMNRIVACTPAENVVLVTGARHELANMDEA